MAQGKAEGFGMDCESPPEYTAVTAASKALFLTGSRILNKKSLENSDLLFPPSLAGGTLILCISVYEQLQMEKKLISNLYLLLPESFGGRGLFRMPTRHFPSANPDYEPRPCVSQANPSK